MSATVFRPHPGPQTHFLHTSARDVFFGGAAGPGKSVCGLAGGLRYFHLPNYRGKAFRRTRKMAQELIIKCNRMVKAAFPGARYNGSEHAFIHPSGGRFEIGYLRHDMDLENEEGQEYQYVLFDELCQFPEHQAKFLHSRLRSDSNLPLFYRGTGNPRGIGLLWVKQHYVDPAPPMTTHWHKFKAPDGRLFQTSTMFVPGRLEDNPTLGEDYERSLAAIGNPKLYEALRFGKWDALLGDAFPEWDPDVHVISWADFAMMHDLILRVRTNARGYQEEYVEIPEHWPVYMSYDWGTARPFSVGWWCCDDHGRIYRIYEWYGAQRTREGATVPNQGIHMSTSDQARGILEREERWGLDGRVEVRFADPSIANGHARKEDIAGPDIQEIMGDEGVHLTLANNDRLQGKAQIHERLRTGDFVNADGTIDETPGMMVLSHCKDWLRTVPLAPTSTVNPEDVDKTAELHAYDETRYVLMGRPYKAKLEAQQPDWLARRNRRRRSRGDAA